MPNQPTTIIMQFSLFIALSVVLDPGRGIRGSLPVHCASAGMPGGRSSALVPTATEDHYRDFYLTLGEEEWARSKGFPRYCYISFSKTNTKWYLQHQVLSQPKTVNVPWRGSGQGVDSAARTNDFWATARAESSRGGDAGTHQQSACNDSCAMETQTREASPRSPSPPNHAFLPDSTTKAEILLSTISLLSEELARCDGRVLRYKNKLEQVKANRAALKAHYDELRSLLSPIRRLPSEVLVLIFAFVASLRTMACDRVGHTHLMDTIELDMWCTPPRAKKALRLLRLALQRAEKAPLNLRICVVDGMDCVNALKLLAGHCEQWKTLFLSCRSPDFHHLSLIKGKLSLLETLEVEVYGTPCTMMDLFDVVPRLRTFVVGGLLHPTVAETHLKQLHTFGCFGQDPPLIPTAVSFMPRLPHALTFRFQLLLSDWTDDNGVGIDLPPTSSNISSLSMDIRDYFDAAPCVKALSDIFTSLTLPHLGHFNFRSAQSPLFLMYWPHSAFIDLAARSSFQTHLESLCLCDVVVTEAELIEALAALPSLQRLTISDHQIIRDCGAHQLLITDSLFSALTLKPDSSPLVSRLLSLTCQSLLQFDDRAYLSFLLSRRSPSGSAPFLSRMYWLQGHHRELDTSVVVRLRELRIQKEVVWEFSRAELWSG
ncbi:hypothetical protein C8R44DRAFT_953125 [Mycena epipterygia]|nr:hypothetical protein C8R44DRAFT_953125 [Mycena epipterygia]